ncbi:MAG TPA: hypothetical protein VIG53_02015 [Actinomycetota bacterium]
MTVSYDDPDPEGLAELLGRLIEQNLKRDPARFRLLRRPSVVAIEAIDAEVGATIRIRSGAVALSMRPDPGAPVRIRADGHLLFEMVAAPTRLGLPDPTSRDGRAIIAAIVRGRIRVHGLLTRFPAIRRLTMLLTAN